MRFVSRKRLRASSSQGKRKASRSKPPLSEAERVARRAERGVQLYLELCDFHDRHSDDMDHMRIDFYELQKSFDRLRRAMNKYDPGLRVYGAAVEETNAKLASNGGNPFIAVKHPR